MSDEEFWEHVLPNDLGEELLDEVDVAALTMTPCVQCGATGPCAYDAEGRPLIHADSQELGE